MQTPKMVIPCSLTSIAMEPKIIESTVSRAEWQPLLLVDLQYREKYLVLGNRKTWIMVMDVGKIWITSQMPGMTGGKESKPQCQHVLQFLLPEDITALNETCSWKLI